MEAWIMQVAHFHLLSRVKHHSKPFMLEGSEWTTLLQMTVEVPWQHPFP